MTYFDRLHAALRRLVSATEPSTSVRSDDRVAEAGLGGVESEPTSWLAIFEKAAAQRTAVASETLRIIKAQVGRYPAETFFQAEGDGRRLIAFLHLRPGLSASLAEMHFSGLLEGMLPEIRLVPHSVSAIQTLERLLEQPGTQSGERFGLMISELAESALLVLALLLHGSGPPAGERDPEESVRAATGALDRLGLSGDARQIVEFLIRNQSQMVQVTQRGDPSEADVERLSRLVGTEERLKMLCLMTIANLGAAGPDALTPWKEELLWRLFVDAYHQLTVAYGDEVIDDSEAGVTALQARRPADISEEELAALVEGLPRRYLTLFDADSIFQHVRLWRDIQPDTVHFVLKHRLDLWELAVVTLDKPYLFSNICGVLAFFGMDILRGYAFTSRVALVVDVFQFADRDGFFETGPARAQFDSLLVDVVAGRADITSRLRDRASPPTAERTAPIIYFDNDSSNRYTVLEVVTDDAPGLLHRVSRVISRHGCAVDLVLISTEGRRAVDVFHMRKGTSKLSDSDQLALTEDLEMMLEAPAGGPTP